MKKKSVKILILSMLLTLITASMFFFFLKIIENKNKHTSKILSVLELKMIEKENLDFIKDELEETQIIQNKINGYFLEKKNVDLFVESLENLGNLNKSKLIIKEIESIDEKNSITLNFSIEGDFNGVMSTVYSIENLPYIINVKNLYLNKNIEINSLWTADVSLEVLSIN